MIFDRLACLLHSIIRPFPFSFSCVFSISSIPVCGLVGGGGRHRQTLESFQKKPPLEQIGWIGALLLTLVLGVRLSRPFLLFLQNRRNLFFVGAWLIYSFGVSGSMFNLLRDTDWSRSTPSPDLQNLGTWTWWWTVPRKFLFPGPWFLQEYVLPQMRSQHGAESLLAGILSTAAAVSLLFLVRLAEVRIPKGWRGVGHYCCFIIHPFFIPFILFLIHSLFHSSFFRSFIHPFIPSLVHPIVPWFGHRIHPISSSLLHSSIRSFHHQFMAFVSFHPHCAMFVSSHGIDPLVRLWIAPAPVHRITPRHPSPRSHSLGLVSDSEHLHTQDSDVSTGLGGGCG